VILIIYIVLNKTTFGFELKACGFNRNAARYAGINDTRGIILSMFISGALSGLAGGLVYISSIAKVIDQSTVLQREGFDGISVALLGLNNPIGIIFSGFFISMLRNAGVPLSRSGYNEEVVRIMTSTIIYASAFSLLFRENFTRWLKRKEVK
jgi:simple sugar transport system permease protein